MAYSIPESGINIAPVVVGERDLRSLHMPPFEAAIREANIYSIMPGYHEIDGLPVHASHGLLSDLLRDEWNFKGYVFSDYTAIEMLHNFHNISSTKKEAARQALSAGVDLEAPSQYAYGELIQLVESGELDESTVDQAVRRILVAKFRAGLFDKPFIVSAGRDNSIHTPEHIRHARKMSEESIVLLKNQKQFLPLDENKRNQ